MGAFIVGCLFSMGHDSTVLDLIIMHANLHFFLFFLFPLFKLSGLAFCSFLVLEHRFRVSEQRQSLMAAVNLDSKLYRMNI